MYLCLNCLENKATYFDMASKYRQWCYDCVPKGCSCNDEYIEDYVENDKKDEYNKEKLLKNIEEYNYKAVLKTEAKEKIINNKVFFRVNILKEIKDRKEIILLLKNNSINELKKWTFVPLDKNNNEFTCCEIIEDENDLKIKEIIYHFYYNKYFIINEEYKNSFKCYEITNYSTLEFEKENIKNINDIEIDNSNPIYINKNGISYEKKYIDLYFSNSFIYYDKHNIVEFLNKYIFNNKDISLFLKDKFDEYNNSINYFATSFIEEKKQLKNYKKLIKAILKDLKTYKIKTIKKKNIKYFIKTLFLYHYYNDLLENNSLMDNSIHIGCDCGCGGNLINDNDYVQLDKLLKKRKNLFKQLFNFIF